VVDLLHLSRLEANDRPREATPQDLAAILRESFSAMEIIANKQRLQMELDCPKTPVWIAGERDAAVAIVDNLLDNAMKYTPAGGRVVLRLVVLAGEARLEVEDTGIGIATADQERVFERFYRVDKARSRELGGTGLGLSIVKHACNRLGGSVRLASAAGKGSTFIVRLSTAPAPAPGPGPG
jgi:two-component system phosphate regulon sensor histidine kinase PhoR